ncbi:hypothetical protein L611_001300000100 [Aminobacter sp. J15]|nr:hypothetical protein L610_000600000940 [Aminobacter sp. J44]TWH35381.1 hypothetical protein L611_001300000100 [Aminobacter sp. J15]
MPGKPQLRVGESRLIGEDLPFTPPFSYVPAGSE